MEDGKTDAVYTDYDALAAELEEEKSKTQEINSQKLSLEEKKEGIARTNYDELVDFINNTKKFIPAESWKFSDGISTVTNKVPLITDKEGKAKWWVANHLENGSGSTNLVFIYKDNTSDINSVEIGKYDAMKKWIFFNPKFEECKLLDSSLLEAYKENLKAFLKKKISLEKQHQKNLADESRKAAEAIETVIASHSSSDDHNGKSVENTRNTGMATKYDVTPKEQFEWWVGYPDITREDREKARKRMLEERSLADGWGRSFTAPDYWTYGDIAEFKELAESQDMEVQSLLELPYHAAKILSGEETLASINSLEELRLPHLIESMEQLIAEEKACRRTAREYMSPFNRELSDYTAGKLPKNHVFSLGLPGIILQECGFPKDQRIEMSASRLEFKSKLERHPFSFSDIKGLDSALQTPVAVFAYGDRKKSQNVVVGIEKDGKNFLVGIHFNQKTRGYEVSDIRTLYPKENIEWLNWINQGKMIYGEKEKLQALIAQQRMNYAEVSGQVVQSPLHEHCLESAESILQKFGDVNNVFTDGYAFYTELAEQSAIEQKFFAYYTEKGNLDARNLARYEAKEFYTALKTGNKEKIHEYTETDLHEVSALARDMASGGIREGQQNTMQARPLRDGPATITVNGIPRRLENGLWKGFVSAVKLVDRLTAENHMLRKRLQEKEKTKGREIER